MPQGRRGVFTLRSFKGVPMAEYGELTAEMVRQLQEIVGEGNCLVGDDIGDDYMHDEMPIYGSRAPEVLCFPETTEQVSAIMRLCHDADVPVTVRGAGTGLVGGCVPLHGGVVLCTMNMDKILEYDLDNLTVRVQPGVRLCNLIDDVAAHGLFYPPDPGEKTGSIGGNVVTNAGGMRAVKYGTTRDYVLAATAVLPDGEVLELGRAVTKSSSGYSLLHLIIGSEGTLAVITEITLKLVASPVAATSFILPFADIDAAIASVPPIKRAGLDPQSIEFMERDIVVDAEAHTGNQVFPAEVDGQEAGAYILVTLDGSDEEEIFQRAEQLAEIAAEAGAFDVLVIDQPSERKAVWEVRDALLTVIEHDADLLDEMDVVVPVNHIPEFLGYVYGVGAEEGMHIRSFGHAGDGNLHVYCAGNDVAEDVFLPKAKRIMDCAYAKCAELGGQVSGEHGIGHAKKDYLRESVGETAYGLMSGIKRVFDPKGILNPGKVCD